ncbi:MAG: aminotransferase class V-fold PLP-dependent enzyme [Clostridia bacterium]|nr:aminotransferase class V-fold PLP-dependent enzyme [Clostridia bacterium]
MQQNIIYFDNAATTFPKPQSVLNAAYECMSDYCGNAGRGSHPIAMMSAEKVFEARVALADFFGSTPENVVFTLNTTYALNMAIKGVMSGGGHMLISNMEHNSTLRPAARMARDNVLRYDIFKAYDRSKPLTAKDILADVISKLRKDTKMLTCIHSSNICSYSLPIREIGQLCRRHGILFCVDAAQSAGHLPINMEKDCIDILCLPAHKGLYSPQGCGIMIMRKGLQKLATLTEGGNGVNSLELSMGNESPERYESGTLCTPAIAGLVSGIEFLNSFGLDTIASHERKLWRRTYDQLSSIENVTIYDDTEGSVLLFNINDLPADNLGALLSDRGFCLRTGYHCSPLAHNALGTADGGAVRIGFGIFNTEGEVDSLCTSIRNIADRYRA